MNSSKRNRAIDAFTIFRFFFVRKKKQLAAVVSVERELSGERVFDKARVGRFEIGFHFSKWVPPERTKLFPVTGTTSTCLHFFHFSMMDELKFDETNFFCPRVSRFDFPGWKY